MNFENYNEEVKDYENKIQTHYGFVCGACYYDNCIAADNHTGQCRRHRR